MTTERRLVFENMIVEHTKARKKIKKNWHAQQNSIKYKSKFAYNNLHINKSV